MSDYFPVMARRNVVILRDKVTSSQKLILKGRVRSADTILMKILETESKKEILAMEKNLSGVIDHFEIAEVKMDAKDFLKREMKLAKIATDVEYPVRIVGDYVKKIRELLDF